MRKNIANIPGWRSKRKLVVIESDDWGSIRMPSMTVFNILKSKGIDLSIDDGFRYNKYDGLATAEDLSRLFEVLGTVRDKTDRNAVFTPVCVVANPDFNKILANDFTQYFYEPITDTLRRFPECEFSFKLWEEGIRTRLFLPQFHGREHLNVKVWMKALGQKHNKTLDAFNQGFWGLSTALDPDIGLEFQAAFDFNEPSDINYHKEILVSGLQLFEELFGYKARYLVPPNGPFSSALESLCYKEGIRYLYNSLIQTEPLGNGKIRKRIHWLGQKSESGLTSITRNCFFEPGEPGKDWVDSCMNDISIAFRWHKPAVISSHRVNFIGALHKENRDNGLKQLGLLLNQITKKWPEAEFITTDELGEIISND